MGRPGSALNSAVIESFQVDAGVRVAITGGLSLPVPGPDGVAAWIDRVNTIRRHWAIGMIYPAAWEATQDGGQAA